ncbi:MAG: glycosyltransferase family 2 protein, partial [Candidatus Pacebacteria bacterium]|nr:glycosyltransferase family 2 protein [Candidatus Paceibacterota bacterium]
MKNNPKISIIMPVYNVETFLSEAIESVLNQTFYDFEFVIINDGSTDNSLEIIKNYEKKDSRIVLLDNKENLGITKSLNIGLNKARGEYIARMDGDDISEKERIEIQYDFLKKNRD